jgi:hypothetical protein
MEESGADIQIEALLGVYAVPRIGQVHLIYSAKMLAPRFHPTEESLDARLFPATREGIPWDELAFPVNQWALRDVLSLKNQPVSQPFASKPEDLLQRMSKVDYHPDYPPPEVGKK